MLVQISNMNLSDLNEIQDILTIEFDDFWNKEIFKEELIASSSKYIVAKYENEIVGFAGLKFVFDEADIMNIVTKKSFRNQGIGSLLLENLIRLSNELNLKSISLEVNEENITAINLYKNFGFQELGIRKNYYKDKNAIIMRKNL